MKSVEISQDDFKSIEDAVGTIKSLAVILPQVGERGGYIKEIITQCGRIQRLLENGTLLDYSDADEAEVEL